jgi:hypothetical protein
MGNLVYNSAGECKQNLEEKKMKKKEGSVTRLGEFSKLGTFFKLTKILLQTKIAAPKFLGYCCKKVHMY